MDRSVSEAMEENATPEIKEDPKERMDSRYRAIERLIREAGKKMVKREGRFATTKGAGHGLGLMRIDSIVERLDGYVNRNSEDGAFTTEILLPQQEEPSSGEAAATQL